MAMEITSNYSNYGANYATTSNRKQEVKQQVNSAKSSDKVDTEKYLSELKKKHKEINIMSGTVDTGRRSGNGKTDVRIAPNILAEMASNPEAEAKYGRMLSNIPRLDKWANSMIKALTGSDVEYRQVWIDENGNMGSFTCTRPRNNKKSVNEKRHKEQEELSARIEKRKEERLKFEKWLEKENGEYEVKPMTPEEIGKLIKFDTKM